MVTLGQAEQSSSCGTPMATQPLRQGVGHSTARRRQGGKGKGACMEHLEVEEEVAEAHQNELDLDMGLFED